MLERTTYTDREIWLQTIELGLSYTPDAVPLLFERAKALDALGRDQEAAAVYLDVLELEPKHFGALNDLGILLGRKGSYDEARALFENAVDAEPNQAIGHANLGHMLLRLGKSAEAQSRYEGALALDPGNIEAHRGLSLILQASYKNDQNQTDIHRKAGFFDAPLTTLAYRGTSDPLPVILLVTENSGNVPLERLIDTRTFLVHKIVIESAHTLAALPEHRLIINAVGDVDAVAQALSLVKTFIQRSHAPVINHPKNVILTSRVENALRLAPIPGVRTARVRRVAKCVLSDSTAEIKLRSLGLSFPLLLRSLGYHTGEHFVRVMTPAALERSMSPLPGDHLLAIEFLDLQNADETYTKYRMMIVGDAMYPLHAATSRDWKVHYFSADMGNDSTNRAIDEAFLTDPVKTIGQRAISALAEIASCLGLDYGGIDFALDEDGNVVVFEANATMVVARPGRESQWDYRREAVAAVDEAVSTLLQDRAGLALAAR